MHANFIVLLIQQYIGTVIQHCNFRLQISVVEYFFCLDVLAMNLHDQYISSKFNVQSNLKFMSSPLIDSAAKGATALTAAR